jgi:MscS family membrane protein
MLRLLFALLFTLISLSTSPAAHAETCATPRQAADSLFVNLTTGNYSPEAAAICFDVPAGASGPKLAVQLKSVLDAREHWVPVSTMSDNPEFGAEDGYRVIPMPEDFPVLVLARSEDNRWLYSHSTLSQVPHLYSETFSPFSLWVQSQLPSAFQYRVPIIGIFLWQGLYGVLLFALAWVAGRLAQFIVQNQLRSLVKRSGITVPEALYDGTRRPIVALVILAVLIWGVPDLQLGIRTTMTINTLCWVATGIAAAYLLIRMSDIGASVANAWASNTESKLDDQLIPLLRQAIQSLILVLAFLFALDAIGIDVWKLAAGVGIGGLAFALAAQDTVANLFGSVNIFIDKPFQIGDWVKIGGVEGVVEEVGFRSTRVRTFHNSVVTVPNSKITNANIDNMGLRPRRRVKLILSLTYDTNPNQIRTFVEGVRAILARHPDVQRTYEAHFHSMSSSSLDVLVYYHLVVPGWHEELTARSQILLEIMALAEEINVSFAYPSTSVYVESTPDNPLQPRADVDAKNAQQIADSYAPGGSRVPEASVFERGWSVQARDARGE